MQMLECHKQTHETPWLVRPLCSLTCPVHQSNMQRVKHVAVLPNWQGSAGQCSLWVEFAIHILPIARP